jgi:acetyltransferase-like isoleucine patch superfamily enzyme
MIKFFLQVWRHSLARTYGAELSDGVVLGPQVQVSRGWSPSNGSGRIRVGARCRLEVGAVLHAYGGFITLAENTFVGPYAVIYGHGGVSIGENTLISMHCRILSSEHTIPDAATLIRSQPDILKPTQIGSDVWLGAGVSVLGGVSIGDGCVVGAGAVVTRDLPPRSIALGVPARITGQRGDSASGHA